MAKTNEPTTIKKYANRRLYNTGTSTYVTLEDLAVMVKKEEDFVVVDAKTGVDITRSVLTQIIFDEENKGTNLLPISFLRQLIRFYGDQMEAIVPSFLDASITSLTRDQDKLRDQMTGTFGVPSFEVVEEHTRRNMEMFDQALKMFNPFVAPAKSEEPSVSPQAEGNTTESGDDLSALRDQIADMQRKVEALSNKKD
ncbi:MAG: polyhydroxyalkanoate synthesis repressor PhaR [Hyphomicrobiales bacterium]